MVKIGFVVEGASERVLVNSESFRNWLINNCNLEIAEPIVDAGGNGQMCSKNIDKHVALLRKQAAPDKLVVLADLDPETCIECITDRKKRIGDEGIDLVVIANKTLDGRR